MCLDPVSMAAIASGVSALGGASTLVPLGLGVGTSLLGGQMTANAQREQQGQQLNQNLASQEASNNVLNQFLATQRQLQGQNQKTLNTAITSDSQPALAAEQANAANTRINDASTAVGGIITPNVAPPSATGSSAVQNDLNARTAAGQGRATADNNALANAGAYNDANQYMSNNASTAQRAIGTTDEFAQSDAALLPSEQQLAQFEARVSNPVEPMSTWGSTVSGLGNVFAALAGSGKLKNVFGSS